MWVLLRAGDQSFVAFNFFVFLHPLEKGLPMNPPLPSEISAFEPPSPSEFPVTFRGAGGGGMDIFWNHILVSV